MAIEPNALTQILLRWVHFVSGIVWIGLLYYFNVVQMPAFKTLDASVRSQNIQRLVPRALFWFRYGALVTVLSGALLLYMEWDELGVHSDGVYSVWAWNIGAGATLGIIMFLNVWLVIWPNQKKVIAANVEATDKQTPVTPEAAKWAKTALYASRTNVLLSLPMLWFMAAAKHTVFDGVANYSIGAIIFALGVVWLYIYTHMKPMGTTAPPPTAATPKP